MSRVGIVVFAYFLVVVPQGGYSSALFSCFLLESSWLPPPLALVVALVLFVVRSFCKKQFAPQSKSSADLPLLPL